MTERERIKALEAALIKYVELYGATEEVLEYFARLPIPNWKPVSNGS